jgi:transposase-like protein
LDQAIAKVFPNAEHRWCARHLYANFRAEFPGILLRTLFWKAAKSYCEWEFKEAMESIKKANPKAYEWLEKIPSKMWARSHFDPGSKSDHITNNMTESFNQWIGTLRGKPVLTLVESLVIKIMGKVAKKYGEGLVWDGNLTPNVMKKLKNIKDKTKRLSLVPAGYMEYLVNDNGKKFPVDLKKMKCTCKFWEIFG